MDSGNTKNPVSNLAFQDGLELYKNGFIHEGTAQILTAASLAGFHFESPDNCPWILLAEESWSRAVTLFLQIESTCSDWWEPPFRLASAYLELRNNTEFSAWWERASHLGAPENLLYSIRLQHFLLQDELDSADRYLEESDNPLNTWQRQLIRDRIRHRREVVRFSGSRVALRLGLWVLKILGDSDNRKYLETYIDRTVHAFPKWVTALSVKRWYHEHTRDTRKMDLREERWACAEIIHRKPRKAMGYRALARSYSSTFNFIRTEEICREGIGMAPRDSELWILLGNALCGQERFGEALSAYGKVMDPVSRLNTAAVHLLMNQPDEARDCMDTGKFDPVFEPFSTAVHCILDGQTGEVPALFEKRYPWTSGRWHHNGANTVRNRITHHIIERHYRKTYRSQHAGSGEPVSCQVCGAGIDHFQQIYQNRITGFRVAICKRCDLIMTNPMPTQDQLVHFYSGEYFTFDMERAEWFTGMTGRIMVPLNYYDARFNWLESLGLKAFEEQMGASRQALDIGCGVGLMLNELRQRGWECTGLEIETSITDYLAQVGYKTLNGTPETVDIPEGGFQFLHLAHVIEHVPEPRNLLRAARQALTDDGWLFLITPCCRSVPAVFTGREWFNDPMHVFFFDRISLLQLVQESGFEIMGVHQPVGVRFETNGLFWRSKLISPAMESLLTRNDLGDVIWILAKAV
jgi:SAM-dependent methyltransferase/tetratricopeptide (TPR) repeat protein